MKKIKIIFFVLLILCLLGVGFSKILAKNHSNIEENTIILNVISYSDTAITGIQENTSIKYKILNSQINLTDYNDNSVSWDELKNSKVIKVYYLGKIKEVSPAIFDKITKIVIIS